MDRQDPPEHPPENLPSHRPPAAPDPDTTEPGTERAPRAGDGSGPFAQTRVGDVHGNVYFSYGPSVAMPGPPPDRRRRAQDFLVSVNEQALRHANDSFRMSMVVMGTGALVIGLGVVLGLLLPLITSADTGSAPAMLASGVTGGSVLALGTALALHAHRSRKHLAEQARKVHDELRLEEAIDRVMDITESLNDPGQGDNLRVMAALRILGLEPTQESVGVILRARRSGGPHGSEPPPAPEP
ncbi:hypothetical protein ABZ635_07165 [Nocardiopsis sp. NPDC007018]|uniref:TRADD-N-associated membrane domain-containing protein n=1 Tax=Nocardiopsis sp. NPDC007018 TaxID=3155721 RepID=UPI0033F0A27F